MLKKPQVHSRNRSIFKHRKIAILLTALIVCNLMFVLLAAQPLPQAQTDQALATKYAPVLHFTSGEKFYPTTVDYIMGSSVLKHRENNGASSTVVDAAPTPSTLGTHTGDQLFLDNKLGTFDAIAADYAANGEPLGYTAYVHVVNSGSSTVIQYWLFYVYNNGPLNNHQGDIEVIEVFLNSVGIPQQVLLSQHGSGENAAWGDMEKVDDHPVVYVAEGSHANYFRSYQGTIGIESDVVGANGKTINPSDLNLVMLGEQGDHPANQSWLDFPGRWGYYGTDQEVSLGQAGPKGPVFNQNGTRWAQPQDYLNSTVSVNGTYFMLAWLVVNFLLLFLIYVFARGAWKGWCIYRLHRRGGLRVLAFLRGPGGIGLMVGIAALVLTAAALFLPWYTVTASSDVGQLSQGATLMTLDGIHGLTVNMFVTANNSDATSGYVSLFSTQMPFALFFAAGVILLALDVIGIKNPKSLGKKLMLGAAFTLLPIILILVFISQLQAFLPFAYSLFPGQAIPTQAESIVRAISGSPLMGTAITEFPVIGATTVNWGLGIGAYLFLVAALLRIIGGVIMYTGPKLGKHTDDQTETTLPPPPKNYDDRSDTNVW